MFGRKFSRDIKQRKSLFKNLINALVIHEEIQTTESKAKAVKGLIDKLITGGKQGSLNARRRIAAFLQDKKAVNKIVDELGPRFKNRMGGFTRIIKIGKRQGDDAMMVKMELVDKVVLKEKVEKKEKPKEAKKSMDIKETEKGAEAKETQPPNDQQKREEIVTRGNK